MLTGGSLDVNNSKEDFSKRVTLNAQEKRLIINDFCITYSDYGHEHVSSGPDEPFAATVGFYSFLLSDNLSNDSITLYQGVNQASSEQISWKNYVIKLLHVSNGQREVTVEINWRKGSTQDKVQRKSQ